MLTPAPKSPAGPRLAATDVGVHIIFVPISAVSADLYCGQVSTVVLAAVAAHIGAAAPHDIVVFAGQPFHFAGGQLREHPRVHHDYPETVVKVHRLRNERAVWWSERPFAMTRISPHETLKPGKVEMPFALPKTEPERAFNDTGIFVARSTIPDIRADDQEYKITFTIDGELQPIDPNMYCDPSP